MRKAAAGWFVEEARDDPVPNLYTFAHAGGRDDRFLELQSELDGVAHIVGVCAPGTGHRFTEARLDSVVSLADAAAEAIAERETGTFFLFGHSFGAMVAFEVARRIPVAPAGLLVSGCSGPGLLPSQRVARISSLSPDEFAGEVRRFGGIPPEIESGSRAETLLMDRLRQDFAMAASYRFDPGPPLKIPTVALVGRDDPHVKVEGVARWQEVTAHPLELHEADGGHFYFDENATELPFLLKRAMNGIQTGVVTGESDSEVIQR